MENTTTENKEGGVVHAETATPFVPMSEVQRKPVAYEDQGWSWGAFALNWIFVIALRKYSYLLLLLLLFVPILNFFVLIGMMIYMGINGREIARTSSTFSNHDQYLGFMKGIDHAGKALAIFYILALAVPAIIAFFVFSSLNTARESAKEAIFQQQQAEEGVYLE